ncbi:MAG: IclR family transcriptional regulator [Bryobacteraceae bacterium]
MGSTLRCLKALELLAEEPFELTLSDIAASLDAPRPTAHRFMTTLVEAGFAEQDEKTKRYRLASRCLWVGTGYLRHSPIYRASFFPMQDLAKHAPGTVQLGIRDSDDSVLFLHSVGYTGSPHAFADVGLRRPIHATATGKVLMSELPIMEVEQIMATGREKYTERTITSPQRMKQELTRVRQNGYALNNQELLPGYIVLASPVRRRDGAIEAAISLTLPVEVCGPRNETEYAGLVKEAARKTSLQLGFRLRAIANPLARRS